MTSHLLNVFKRCATIIIVKFFSKLYNSSIINLSVSVSKELVASSKIIISEFLYKDLASQTLCIWPLDN